MFPRLNSLSWDCFPGRYNRQQNLSNVSPAAVKTKLTSYDALPLLLNNKSNVQLSSKLNSIKRLLLWHTKHVKPTAGECHSLCLYTWWYPRDPICTKFLGPCISCQLPLPIYPQAKIPVSLTPFSAGMCRETFTLVRSAALLQYNTRLKSWLSLHGTGDATVQTN